MTVRSSSTTTVRSNPSVLWGNGTFRRRASPTGVPDRLDSNVQVPEGKPAQRPESPRVNLYYTRI